MPKRKRRRIVVTEREQSGRNVGMTRLAERVTVPVARSAQPREGILQEDKKRPELPLKKVGGLIDVELAQSVVRDLRRLLNDNPQEFQALVALVDGRRDVVSQAAVTLLRDNLFLGQDGSPLPVVAEVLRAAYRPATPDGPCVVEALDLTSPKDVAVVEQVEKSREQGVRDGPRRLLRDLLRDEEQADPSNSNLRQRLRDALRDDPGEDRGRG